LVKDLIVDLTNRPSSWRASWTGS